jgi:hypothetical protein
MAGWGREMKKEKEEGREVTVAVPVRRIWGG